MTPILPALRRILQTAHGTAIALLCCAPARASFLAGETLDKAADVMSWAVLVIVPIVVIAVFWMLHVLPEKIAHKRHHPQRESIQTLCLLSLVFGGLLWPLAWLWAFTKPIGYKAAYGTDKHEDYFTEALAKARAGTLAEHEIAQLDAELEGVQTRAALAPELHRQWLELRESRRAAPARTAAGVSVPPAVAHANAGGRD